MCIDVVNLFRLNGCIFHGQGHAAGCPLPIRCGRGNVIGIPVGPIANHLGVNLCPPLEGFLPFFQDQNTGALGQDKAIPILFERAACPLRFLVTNGKGLHSAESPDAQGRDGCLCASRDDCILKT